MIDAFIMWLTPWSAFWITSLGLLAVGVFLKVRFNIYDPPSPASKKLREHMEKYGPGY